MIERYELHEWQWQLIRDLFPSPKATGRKRQLYANGDILGTMGDQGAAKVSQGTGSFTPLRSDASASLTPLRP